MSDMKDSNAIDGMDRQTSRNIGVMWFVIGLAMVAADVTAGWIFFILGMSYYARSTEQGENWSSHNPRLVRWILIVLTVLILLVVLALLANRFLLPEA